MKARVKATGEIVEVRLCGEWANMHRDSLPYRTNDGVEYSSHDLSFKIDDERGEPQDYWTRLEHQYAGMAMQGISEKYFKEYRDYCAGFGDMDEDEAKGAMEDFANAMADVCYYFAHALVEKMKEVK